MGGKTSSGKTKWKVAAQTMEDGPISKAAMKRADTTTMEKYKMQGVKQHPGMTVSTMKTSSPAKTYKPMAQKTYVERAPLAKGMASRMMKEREGRIKNTIGKTVRGR